MAESAAPSVMEIPTIPDLVPDWYVYHSNSKKTAKLTLALIDLGIITEKDAALPTMQQAIESGLARWFKKTAEGIQFMVPSLLLADDRELMGVYDDYEGRFEEVMLERGIVPEEFFALAMTLEQWTEFCVNANRAEIESVAPGLYGTALARLYAAADSITYMAHGPYLQAVCRRVYWYGCEDEKEFLEEMGDEEEVNYTKADLVASLTPELLTPEAPLTDQGLIALTSREGKVGELAKAVLDLKGNGWLKKPISPAELNLECGEVVATLRNNVEDDAQRVLDDYSQMLGESGDATHYTAFYFANPTASSVEDALKGVESYCEMLRRLERVLLLIADKTWPE